MENPIKDIAAALFEALFVRLGMLRYNWLRKRRLRRKLLENGDLYPKGFRSTKRLMDDIQADRETTVKLLIEIGARKSEKSDEWKLS